MCGRSLSESGRPSESADAMSALGHQNHRPQDQPSDPSAGHKLRDSSPDRRVYTSALGQTVPTDLAGAIEAAVRRSRGTGARSGGAAARSENRDRLVKPELAPTTDKIRVPGARPQGLLPEVFRSLLWAMLLSTLGAAVAWGVYAWLRRGVQPEPPRFAAVQPAKNLPSASSSRTRAPGRPAVRPAAGHDLVIPVSPLAGSLRQSAQSPAISSPPPVVPSAQAALQAAGASALPLDARRLPHDQSLDDIEFVASTHSPQVRACYDRAFRHAGAQAPAGRVELSFVLVDTGQYGRAVDIATELNMLAEPSVAACLEERVAEWQFPRPPPSTMQAEPKPVPRRLRYPFVFTPAPP
jgi:hypothetical protein